MTASFFPILFDMSAGASVLITAVLLFRFFARKFPKKYILLLWAVVLLRLICPLQPISNLSMIPPETVSFAKDTTISESERTEISALSAADAALRAVGDAANGGLDTIYIKLDRAETDEATAPTVTAYHDQVWLLFLEKLWPVGAVGLLLWQGVSYLRWKRRLMTAVPYDGELPVELIPRGTAVLSADGTASAFVLGIFRPKIYLPSDLPQDAVPYVLAHEGVHLRRRDPLWKTLAFLALCLHWYNPLVWAAYFCASADIEYSCDEAAVRLLGGDSSEEYAQTLLSLTAQKPRRFGMLSLDSGNVGGRIRRLLGTKPNKALCIIMIVCTVFLCLLGIGNPPTDYKTDTVVLCTLDGEPVPIIHGTALVDAINDASRTVNRSYDAVGTGMLDHTAVITYADGSYLEINYLYVSDYSFHPAHPGEDDYKTVLWYRDAQGKTVETYVMEYDFDAVFSDWMRTAQTDTDGGEVIVHAPADSETGMAILITEDRQTADVPMLPVPYDKSPDYDRLPEVTVSADSVIRLIGFGGDTLRVGEDYYENRGSWTYIDQQTHRLSPDMDGIFTLSVAHRNPKREESAVYYIAAEECRYVFRIRYVPIED